MSNIEDYRKNIDNIDKGNRRKTGRENESGGKHRQIQAGQ